MTVDNLIDRLNDENDVPLTIEEWRALAQHFRAENERHLKALREIAFVVADRADLLSLIWDMRDIANEAIGLPFDPRPERG